MKQLSILLVFIVTTFTSQAKIWRINNNAGVTTDFTSFYDAVNAASVVAGDTLHFESSTTEYETNGITVTKRLVYIGLGYLLDPSNASFTGNAGLQASVNAATLQGVQLGEGANGSKFLGLALTTIQLPEATNPLNLTVERCSFTSGIYLFNANHNGLTIRKCFFFNARIEGNQGTLTNFTCENNIFYSSFAFINLPILTGSTNIVRNNSFLEVGVPITIQNCYVANNIFGTPGVTFTNCAIKNNFFSSSSVVLPGTATNNQTGVDMSTVYIGGTTGSFDSRARLKAGSPALAAGLTIGSVVTPDLGAFGATDPYKLSGIPNIPSIYSLTVPISVPSGSTTMNVIFSTRNNN